MIVLNPNLTWPIGIIMWTEFPDNPSKYFGGTWIKLTDFFPYSTATTSQSEIGTGGGENSVSLTVNQLPKHKPVTEAYETIACARWAWESGSGSYFSVNDNQGGYRIRAIAQIGNDEAHNNMPKFRKMYCWKRTV